MNDRYLYRAKRTDNGEWVEGFLARYDERLEVANIVSNEILIPVISSTICQCTGRMDEDNKLIYEHDIVSYLDAYSTENGWSESYQAGEVLWDDETLSFQVTERLSAESYDVLGGTDCKVLGNSFDNQELLEV